MSLVLLEIADGVATITLNNPDERNTMTAPMVAEIVAAMDRIENDPAIGALVVTGTAPAFLNRLSYQNTYWSVQSSRVTEFQPASSSQMGISSVMIG